MRLRVLVVIFTLSTARAVLIDRIAVVVGRAPILDSDIVRDIRVTAFLNHQRPDFALTSRKQAASRLIDQELIRQQIRFGGFPVASQQETTQLLKQIEQDRGARFSAVLEQDGISKAELRDRLSWQLTVLRFIDAMFRPQVIVSDADVEKYYQSHRDQFDSKSLSAARPAIETIISGEKLNALFESWLDQTRKSTRIIYLEKSLA